MTVTRTLVGLQTKESTGRDGSDTGLHGHSFHTHLLAVTFAEATGTFVLVISIVGTAVGATLAKPIAGDAFDSLTVALAGGIALTVLVATFGSISGAHFNPAVTLGLAISRTFPWSRVPAYVLGQLSGAVCAALTIWWFYGAKARTLAHLGALSPAPGVSGWRAFGAEAIVTCLLVLVIILVAPNVRGGSSVAPLAIGSALAAAILISGPISGAGVNPARSFGPMIATGRFTDWWVYLIAPLAGAAGAVAVGSRLLQCQSDSI